jgi:hypothetical protein
MGGVAVSKSGDGLNADICNEYQSLSYGQFDGYSAMEGSGGGGLTLSKAADAGPGGGIIWIQA